MQNVISSSFRLGILGGGQLGRMLIQAAVNMDIATSVLDPEEDCPAAGICTQFVKGDFRDFDTVYNFGKDQDVITIEIEHVNTDALLKLEKEGKSVFPQPHQLKIIQDKGLQKQFYSSKGLATAPYKLLENKEAVIAAVLDLEIKFPFIVKTRTNGYDGKGVVMIKNESDFNRIPDEPVVVEQAIKIKKEIAVIAAMNVRGDIKCFPAVEMDFNPTANLVEFLSCPADLSPEKLKEAEALALATIRAFDLCGVLAVEMFLDENDAILINEVAPRPHNSGHHTIESAPVSQYEQHLRAILDLPLGATYQFTPSVMLNLLGEPGHFGDVYYKGLEESLSLEGVKVHIYGKKQTKPFRKMGHVTIMDATMDKVKAKAQIVKENLKVISTNKQ
jgi:5-(carboxyamino)imidazole ribonucleotide synthase